MSKQWVIVGLYEDELEGLVCALPRDYTDEQALEILNRMVNNPTAADLIMMRDTKSIWLEKIDSKDAWWNDNCD